MHLLRILVRVAFICNICFILAMAMLWLPGPKEGAIYSLIIILGYVMAIILNGVTTVWFAILFFTQDRLPAIFQPWLLISNFVIFVLQLIFILK